MHEGTNVLKCGTVFILKDIRGDGAVQTFRYNGQAKPRHLKRRGVSK